MADLGVDLERVVGIFLVHAPGADLKCVRAGALGILGLHEGSRRLAELVKRHEIILGDRADSPDAEDMGERFCDFLEIKIPLRLHEDSAIGADHAEISLAGAQGDADLAHQCLLEDMPVFAFDADFGIFDQECVVMVHGTSFFE